MKEYKIEDLDEQNIDIFNDAIDYFSNGELPNNTFLMQFTEPGQIYSNKKYWYAFATILVKRGIPRIDDIKSNLLTWWQDKNWPGFNTIEEFVLNNKSNFIDIIKDKIFYSHQNKDIIWFKNLLELYVSSNEESSMQKINALYEIINYLEEDSWKDFDSIYMVKLNEILKY